MALPLPHTSQHAAGKRVVREIVAASYFYRLPPVLPASVCIMNAKGKGRVGPYDINDEEVALIFNQTRVLESRMQRASRESFRAPCHTMHSTRSLLTWIAIARCPQKKLPVNASVKLSAYYYISAQQMVKHTTFGVSSTCRSYAGAGLQGLMLIFE